MGLEPLSIKCGFNKFAKQPKPEKMSNSFELLNGPVAEIQRKYEILSDIITEYNGKVHGSQSHANGNNISLVVYYEIPYGKRDEVKQILLRIKFYYYYCLLRYYLVDFSSYSSFLILHQFVLTLFLPRHLLVMLRLDFQQ